MDRKLIIALSLVAWPILILVCLIVGEWGWVNIVALASFACVAVCSLVSFVYGLNMFRRWKEDKGDGEV